MNKKDSLKRQEARDDSKTSADTQRCNVSSDLEDMEEFEAEYMHKEHEAVRDKGVPNISRQ